MSKEKDLMGYDPLEWLKEGSESAEPEETTAEVDAVQESEPEVISETIEEPAAAAVEEAEIEDATVETHEGNAVLDLKNSLQIMDVALLKPQMEKSLAELKLITLRADEDIAVDGAGIQLLLAFIKQAQQDGITLQWEALPSPIVEAAMLLNTEQILLAG